MLRISTYGGALRGVFHQSARRTSWTRPHDFVGISSMSVNSVVEHHPRPAGLVRIAIVAATLIATATATPARAETAHAAGNSNAVTDWNRTAVTTLLAFPPPAGG